jgi:hypothetical protein
MYSYLTSQNTLPENFNKSEYLKRLQKDVARIHNTFEIILASQKLDQSYVNKLFPAEKIKEFLDSLTYYDDKISPKGEGNKMEIARHMLKSGFVYYQRRFKETKFLSKKISEVNELIEDLNQLTSYQVEEEENLRLYRLRKRMKLPPKIISGNHWTARCDICWSYGSGNDLKEATKAIHHERECNYDKNDLERCIRPFPPTEKQIPYRGPDSS